MTEKDLFPRKFNIFDRHGRHFALQVEPRWEPDTPRGPDHPQSWGTIPQWSAKILVNGVPVEHADIRGVAAGDDEVLQISNQLSNEPERPQDGRFITQEVAKQIMRRFTEVMDELHDIWLRDREAGDVVDSLLDG